MPLAVTGLSTGVTAISAGDVFACAVANGGLQCWGDNTYGELGNGAGSLISAVPAPVTGLATGVTAIATGGYRLDQPMGSHACAIGNGTLKCWGDNAEGELGDGSANSSNVPIEVTSLGTAVFSDVTAGALNTCALATTTSRQVETQCWGDNSRDQLGVGDPRILHEYLPQVVVLGNEIFANGFEM